tara:strand:+ start:242 stop:685 length:444 start_codon:yes stop_codon:yes gene_type:complete
MPKLDIGHSWEKAYRLRARHVAKGVRISPNGRGDLKATQIFWVRSEINDDGSTTKKTEYASSIHLPWKEEAVEKNLDLIKKIINKSLNKPTIPLRQHLDKTIKQRLDKTVKQDVDDTPLTLTTDPILLELRLIRNYLEKLTLLQETK